MTDGPSILFNKPLIKESLQHLPAAVDHPDTKDFANYLERHLHFNSANTRRRFATYIAGRFSVGGKINPDLATALQRFAGSRAATEILYFELCAAVPVLREAASLWLSEQPNSGCSRASLVAFLGTRVDSGGRRLETVSRSIIEALKGCKKINAAKQAVYVPIWTEPALEAFLYVLARLYPERAMVRVDHLAAQPAIRAMLWPRPSLVTLLDEAHRSGHISRISELDQYHQFTLAEAGSIRMARLVGATQAAEGRTAYEPSTNGAGRPSAQEIVPTRPAIEPLVLQAQVTRKQPVRRRSAKTTTKGSPRRRSRPG